MAKDKATPPQSEIQLFADQYPSLDSVHLAIMDIARLSHAGKHGMRVRELLKKLIAAECSPEEIEGER